MTNLNHVSISTNEERVFGKIQYLSTHDFRRKLKNRDSIEVPQDSKDYI